MKNTSILPVKEQAKLLSSSYREEVIKQGLIDLQLVNFYLAVKSFVTNDPETAKEKLKAIRLSKRNEPVLILGESGTGKELISRILHGKRKGNFIAVNTTALVDTLLESELFGHKRGSFTGAYIDKRGLIEEANDGTLFLDEIGDCSPLLQAKLLRVLENKVFKPVGATRDESVNCRVVAATNKNLKTLTGFRLDLLERLSTFVIRLKPIRERPQDIKLFCSPQVTEIALRVWEKHKDRFCPGNIRQLKNVELRFQVLKEVKEEDFL
jgi:two-component system response regulator HydG